MDIALIGCGNISRFHRAAWIAAGARITWTCDLDIERARAAAADCGARASSDWREAVADPAVTAVVVCSIASSHRAICTTASAAGKAVICEKTLAENADDALAIVEAARNAGRPLWTNYMKRFLPATEQAVALLPEIGRPIAAHVRSWQPWAGLWDPQPEQARGHSSTDGMSTLRRLYGGGVLHCAGSHLLDLTLLLLGRPRRVYASEHVPPDRDYDLRCTALMELPDGCPVSFETCWHPLSTIGRYGSGWEEMVEISGTRGRLSLLTPVWDRGGQQPSILIHDDASGRCRHEHIHPPSDPFAAAAVHYRDAIAAGHQGRVGDETGYAVDELIAALQASARSGQAVDISWRIPPCSPSISADRSPSSPVAAASSAG